MKMHYYLIGPPGSGKTTEANLFRQSNTSFKIVELDNIVWQKEWKKKNQNIIEGEILELLKSKEKIIFEGCYPELLEFFENKGCTILFSDTNLFVCIRRVTSRSLYRIMNNVQIFGNKESVLRFFLPEGILFYTIKTYFSLRKSMKIQKKKGNLQWKFWKNFCAKHYY
ncbi:hypothetical protein [Streptococcus oralis]|uniref:hypothetical protein n=1 Tax=Streptococcus oralis TaxID=1303 RepID=UPI0022842155|nr:hypothetical protein [Streptococcus oralis]MCY7079208.1 hypothetical protein [Streptococcus oralis]